MDSTLGAVIVGVGLAVIVAKSAAGNRLLRSPVHFVLRKTAAYLRPAVWYDLQFPYEWCVYCCGFWCGFFLNLLGYPLAENSIAAGFLLVGVLWPLSEVSDINSSLWLLATEISDATHSETFGDSDRGSGKPEKTPRV